MVRSRAALVLLAAASWFAASPAHADVPPPDTCDEAGEACSNAGESFDQDGLCQQRTCTKGPPGQQMTYDCLRCEVSEGPADPPPGDDDDDDGCSVSGVGTEHGISGALLLLGAGLFLRGRRR